MLITHVEIKGNEQKEQVIFYGRSKDGVESITQDIHVYNPFLNKYTPARPFAISMPFEPDVAREKMLEAKSAFPDIDMQLLSYDKFARIFAQGNSKRLKRLPEYFPFKPSKTSFSVSDMIRRQLGFPFPIIEKRNGIYVVARHATLEESLSLNTAALDSEFMHWEEQKNVDYLNNTIEQKIEFAKVSAIDSTSHETDHEWLTREIVRFLNENKGKYGIVDKPMTMTLGINKIKLAEGYEESLDKVLHMYHLRHLPEEEKISTFIGDIDVRNIKANDEYAMIAAACKNLEREQIVCFVTQNGAKYDLPKNRKFGFKPHGFAPVIKSHSGFYFQTIINGHVIMDLASYAQNHLPFTQDNKYATNISLLTGINFEKSITYDDQTRLTLETMLGNDESNATMKKYDVEDVAGLCLAAKYIKPMLYLKAKMLGCSIEKANVTSKTMSAQQKYSYDAMIEGKSTWNNKRMQKYAKFKTANVLKEMIDKRCEQKKTTISRFSAPKFIDAAMYYVPLLSVMHSAELQKMPAVKETFEFLRRPQATNLEKVDMMNFIEEGLLAPYLFDHVFKQSSQERVIDQYISMITQFPAENTSGNFHCFSIETVEDPHFIALMNHRGIELARGKLLNIDKGSWMLHDKVNMYKREIDTKGKLGYRTVYMAELIHDYVDELFSNGPDAAFMRVADFFKDLQRGNLDRQKLIYFKKYIIKDYWNYSSFAQRQRRIKAYIDLGYQKGQSAAYFTTPDEENIPLDAFMQISDDAFRSDEMKEFLIREYLGYRKTDTNMKKGKVGSYLLPLVNHYRTTQEELCSSLLRGTLPEKTKRQAPHDNQYTLF